MRKAFPSEFSWRLYVALQMLTLGIAAFDILAVLANGKPVYRVVYEPIYEEVDIDHVPYREREVGCRKLSDEPERSGPFVLGSPRQSCLIDLEWSRRRVVGEEFARIDFGGGQLFELLFALVVPFVVVWVPNWLWDGWRRSRRPSSPEGEDPRFQRSTQGN